MKLLTDLHQASNTQNFGKPENSYYEKHWSMCEKMTDTIWLDEKTKYREVTVEAKMDVKLAV